MDSHCHDDVISFHSFLKNFLRMFLVARYCAHDRNVQKFLVRGEPAGIEDGT
jgi:hypothetical protein